jgi:mannose/fructose/N-acetylgalactosamine-specific phosphotransferase system component IIC
MELLRVDRDVKYWIQRFACMIPRDASGSFLFFFFLGVFVVGIFVAVLSTSLPSNHIISILENFPSWMKCNIRTRGFFEPAYRMAILIEVLEKNKD